MDFASFDSQEMPGGGWVVKNHTIYVNPYFVYNGDGYIQDHIPDRFTKHYYAGSERIASRLNREGQSANAHNALANIYTPAVSDQPYLNDLRAVLTAFGMNDQLDSDPAPYPENPIQSEADCYEIFNADQLEYERCLCLHFPAEAALQSIECYGYEPIYWYHPDYIGHTDFVTDRTGQPYQHFFYAPFGEALLSQHTGTGYYNTPYRFNAKEMDSETGLIYYGARYYEPKESVWLSLDPLAHKYPGLSGYNFVANNPIMLVDPDGREWVNAHDSKVDEIRLKLLEKPNSNRLKRQLNSEISKQGLVNQYINNIMESDPDLYNYIDKLTITPRNSISANNMESPINVKVVVSSSDLYSGSNGQKGETYSNPKNSNGNYSIGLYNRRGIITPFNRSGDVGFNITIYGNHSFGDNFLANEVGDVMNYMENGYSPNSGSDRYFRDNGGGWDAYMNSPSSIYSNRVEGIYKERKKTKGVGIPYLNPYPLK